jgi:hypothetical protein
VLFGSDVAEQRSACRGASSVCSSNWLCNSHRSKCLAWRADYCKRQVLPPNDTHQPPRSQH